MNAEQQSPVLIDFRTAFEASPGLHLLLLADAPKYTIIGVSTAYTKASGFTREELLERGVFEVFPANPEEGEESGSMKLMHSLNRVLNGKADDVLEFRYDIPDHKGGFAEKYWRTVNRPVLENDSLQYIIHSTEEISDSVKAAAQTEQLRSMSQVHNLFMQAPVAIHIFKGDDLIIELANKPTLDIWQRDESVVGKPLGEIFPELHEQGIIETLRNVMRTGNTHSDYEHPVRLNKNGTEDLYYFNYVFHPYYESHSTSPTGILVFVNEVTDRVKNIEYKKRVEQAILESEERFRIMAEGADVLILVGDEQGKPVYFNKGWTGITGRSNEELLQKGWTDLIHPDDQKEWREIYLNAFEKKEDFAGEFRLKDKEGNYRWMLGRAPARFHADGSFAGHISSCFDITERKQTEQALQDSIHQVRSIVESAPFPIGVYVGREMRITLANQSIIDVWGKGPDLIGKTYAEMLPELEGTGIYQQLDNVFTTGIPFHAKNTRVDLTRDGKLNTHYFNYSFTPLYDATGKIYGVMNTAAEVTDLNLSRQRAEESERQLQFAIEATELGTFDYDPVSNTFTANARLKSWFGLPSDAAIDLQLAINAVADYDRKRVTETIQQSLDFSSGGKYDIEYTIVNPHTNKEIHVRAKGMVWFNENRAAYRLNGTMQDITEQVSAFQKIEEIVADRTKELNDANNNLKHSNAELAQFAYIASHDLQEPLRKISVFSDMLAMHLSEKGIDAQAQNYLTKINSSSGRMTNLVRDVLLYSELSKEQYTLQPLDLDQVINEIKTDFELLIIEKKAKIITQDLPVINAIPLQMSQLFGNLISNSLKFSRTDLPPEISITATKLTAEQEKKYADSSYGEYHRIIVKDNGIGFDPVYADRIFSIFQRLHERSAYAGTGIGLAMCKKIVQNHHGEITAGGGLGEGALFEIILPSGTLI